MAILDLPTWAPTVTDVALRLISRTRMPNGKLAHTFNSTTLPTDVDVEGIIEQASRLLRPRLGPVPDALADSATALVALKAAVMVEQSYFAEQIPSGLSPYRDMMGEYLASLTAWDLAARGEQPGGQKSAALRIGTDYPGYAAYTA